MGIPGSRFATLFKKSKAQLSNFVKKKYLGDRVVAGYEEVRRLPGHETQGAPPPLTVVHLLVSVLNLLGTQRLKLKNI
jgi:hypothetical protein